MYRRTTPKGVTLTHIEPVEGLNLRMFVDKSSLVGQSLVERGYWEKLETEILVDVLRCLVKQYDSVIFVDVGAHIGYYACLAAKVIDNKGKVYAFEPDPFNYSLLIKNIKINNLKNIIPVNKAMSNKKGYVKLHLMPESGQHSIVHGQCSRYSIDVETTTLDEFFKANKIDKINLIKIDVEGAESYVIEGGTNILKCVDAMFIEFSQKNLKFAGISIQEYLKALESINFSRYFIIYDEKLIRVNSLTDIGNKISAECNLLCIKNELVDRLLQRRC